ncbi:MAG: DnaJ-class molecular chaperone [Paracoccaceae bacterium]|jgi:DnaJ-class molecular chaperone
MSDDPNAATGAGPYAALGLDKTATAADIKAAWRKIVRTNHPDLNPDDPEAEPRFKAMSAAHDLLKDPATRARFDAGEIDVAGAARAPRAGARGYYRDHAGAAGHAYHPGRGHEDAADPADIFAEILRGRAQRGYGGQGGGGQGGGGFSAPGPDLRYTLSVPFLDAARGARTRITVPEGGTIEVAIPQGAGDGQTLRLRGKGAPGYGGGPPGDALVTLSVGAHTAFRRDGADIHLTLPITIDEAVLGAKVQAPTIDGPVTLSIPKGASGGRVLRLRGRGVKVGGVAGDQFVELRIVAPPEDDPALTEFLEGWRVGRAHDPRAELMKGMQP